MYFELDLNWTDVVDDAKKIALEKLTEINRNKSILDRLVFPPVLRPIDFPGLGGTNPLGPLSPNDGPNQFPGISYPTWITTTTNAPSAGPITFTHSNSSGSNSINAISTTGNTITINNNGNGL